MSSAHQAPRAGWAPTSSATPAGRARADQQSKRVLVLTTGGTIASRTGPQGRTPGASGAELLASTRVPDGIAPSVRDLAATISSAWRPEDLVDFLQRLDEALAEDVDGVVVTHGTDAMEEVALLASLVRDDPRPVVFTGAQRPFDDAAPDGPANLADALTTAASPHARDRGVLLAFDGQVFAARGVAKTDTLSAHAFTAPGRGPVLRVADGTVHPLCAPERPRPLLATPSRPLPRVDVVPLYVGVDTVPLRAAQEAGARGIVLAAFGAGNGSPLVTSAVAEVVRAGVVVLVCSRVPGGPVVPLYGDGGGADLRRAGAIFAGDLSPWQGRIVLSAALAGAPHDAEGAVRDWLGPEAG